MNVHVSFLFRSFFEEKIEVRVYLRRRRAHIINWLQASSIRQESRIDLFSLHKVCKWSCKCYLFLLQMLSIFVEQC